MSKKTKSRPATLTIPNTTPHLLEALWDHPDCPKWMQDTIWDRINDRMHFTKFSAVYWASCLESVIISEQTEDFDGLNLLQFPTAPSRRSA